MLKGVRIMNSPYMGKFQVTQQFRPTSNPSHDGIDLVGIDSKEIHSTVTGTVVHAGWENPNNHLQGFGQYVCICFEINSDKWYAYYGHLSEIKVKVGQNVKITDVIGIEGTTGHSTGNHCHYEIRNGFYKGAVVMDINEFSGIPNKLNGVYDDGYRPELNEVVSDGIIINANCKITIDQKNKKIEILW